MRLQFPSRKIILVGLCTVLLKTALSQEDSRVRELVLPVRIVDQSSGVADARVLLEPRFGQVSEGRFGEGAGLVLSSNAWIILDFGRELHGSLQIGTGLAPKRPGRLHVRFGESVSEALAPLGERGACNDHAVRDDIITVPGMGRREIGETGFRFVWLANVGETPVKLEYVRTVSLMRPMKAVGSFRCSDERLNRIFDTAVRTVNLCCQDYLWDGIKRDRLVWAGDLHPEIMAILNVFGAAEVIPQTLDYLAATTPSDSWANGFPTYTLCWVRNLAAWYRFTGDRAYLKRHGDYLEKVFEHVCTLLPDGVWKNEGEFGSFLDWPTHHDSKAEQAGAQALAVLTMDDFRFLFSAGGRAERVVEAERMLDAMRKVHPDPHNAKSAAAMLVLGGLRDPAEMFSSCLDGNGHAGVSTFYGYYMLEAMSVAGKVQRALDTVRDYWGGMLDMGATSFWEDFDLAWTNNCFRIDEMPVVGKKDIHGDYGDFCYKGFRHSLCHGWSSGPAVWCINRVLGIRPLDVGCRKIEIRPCLGDLEWAEGAMALPDGKSLRVSVRKSSDGTLKTDVSAPEWVKTILVPDAQTDGASLQKRIDDLAARGGGTLVLKPGRYESGALFFKPGVNLHLEEGSVLVGRDDADSYPKRITRIEGETCEYYPALVNADCCDGFRITGSGTIDGHGANTWEEFWRKWMEARSCGKDFPNKALMRPRILYVSNSRDVEVSGVTLKNSKFWTAHFYNCGNVRVRDCKIVAEVLKGLDGNELKGPSTDAVDVDKCRDVCISNCLISVNDDGVAIKGGKGNWADDYVRHPENGPSENILVTDCLFKAPTHSCLTLGSECPAATNIIMRNCRVEGVGMLLNLKMRIDTPQHYHGVLVEDCTGNCDTAFSIKPWTQYAMTDRRIEELKSRVSDVVITNCLMRVGKVSDVIKNDLCYEVIGLSELGNAFEREEAR